MAFSYHGSSPCLLVSLLLLSLTVVRVHARHGPEIAVADAQPHSRNIPTEDHVTNSHRRQAQSPEVGASGERQHDASASSSREGGTARTTGTGSNDGAAESIAEWKRRSAEAGAHFFPLQRAEDAPSRDELHRRILMGNGLRDKGGSGKASQKKGFPLPLMAYDSTLLATANGTMGNTMVNYRTTLDNNNEIPLAVYPYYVNLKLGSQKQVFSMALNLAVPDTSVPCDCLHCGSMPPSAHPPTHPRATFPGESEGDNRLAVWECGREIQSVFEGFSVTESGSECERVCSASTTTSKPFTMLSSTTLKYISCSDQRCQTGMDTTYGCSTEGYPNYINFTG
ncbi:unnamed protein product [Closterium sp. NIES-64]|nr:unnamed protein product [Closterium sp. NIES-64]